MKKITVLIVIAFLILINCNAQDIPVLMYHNTYESFSDAQADMNISSEAFETHLKAMRDNGYNAVSIDNYRAYTRGEYTLPSKPVIITFDDGYKSNYLYAYPLLKKYNMPATIFVVTGKMGNDDTMFPHFSWDEAREMEKSGYISIYSHTDTHTSMDTLNRAAINVELRRSKYLIETQLGKSCRVFAAPFGMFNDTSVWGLKTAGYDTLMKVGTLNRDISTEGLLALERISVSGDLTADELLKLLNEYNR